MIFKFHFESSVYVCWRGIALYAAMLLCSSYNFVRCGPLAMVACRLVIHGIRFKEADLSVAPTKFMQLLWLSVYTSSRGRRFHFQFVCRMP
jgi:hypothetical protein